MTDYLEEGAAILRSALETAVSRYNAILSQRKAEDRRELMEARVRVAEGFAALGAAERGAAAAQPEDDRIAKALSYAEDGLPDGDHHKAWVIDQMVRALTGCPAITKSTTDVSGTPYSYEAQGESEAYLRFVHDAGVWDEGIAP